MGTPPGNEELLELLSELKSHLPAELLSAVDKKLQHLAYAELKIQALEAALRAERIKKYGPKSDSLPSAQLNLLEAEPGVSAEEIAAEAGREPIDKVERKASDKKKQHPGRQQLPASLPRIERVIACTVEQCICSACGADTAVIGYDESEQLDVEPAKYFVNLTRREKRGVPGDGSIVQSHDILYRLLSGHALHRRRGCGVKIGSRKRGQDGLQADRYSAAAGGVCGAIGARREA